MLDLQKIDRHKQIVKQIANNTINGGESVWIKNYEFTEHNKPIFNGLLRYFNNIEYSEQFKLNKSIALIGSPGTGKTTIMRIFQGYINCFQLKDVAFRTTSLNDLLSIISDDKNDILTYNLRQNSRGHRERNPINICINEFGLIENLLIYGSRAQTLFENFLMKRYEIYQEFGKKTHITSNLIGSQIEQIFPAILVDRFNEMFNIIPLLGQTYRV